MLSSDRKHEPYHLLPTNSSHFHFRFHFRFLILILCLPLLAPIDQLNIHCHQVAETEATASLAASRHSGGAEPDFEEPIGNYSVALGKDVQLPCKISRLAGFKSAWLRVEDRGVLTIHTNIITPNYRIGLRVEDEGRNFMLTIRNVQPSDRGAYMCQINTVPMKSTIGYLNVLTPPVFEDAAAAGGSGGGGGSGNSDWQATGSSNNQPQAQPLVPDARPQSSLVTSQEKGNVSLSCRASGNPAPTISWRREDNEPILLDGQQATLSTGKLEGPTLFLSQVSRLSAGAYLCIASNGVLPSPSRRLSLEVQFAPVIRLPQTEVGGQVGREARLLCYVEWNPAGSYHWVRVPAPASGAPEEDDASLLESSELVNGDKFELISRQMNSEKVQLALVVRRVERQDFGWYRCIARNSLGAQSSSVRLHESAAAGAGSSRIELSGPAQAEKGSRRLTKSRLEPSTSANTSAAQQERSSSSGATRSGAGGGRMLLLLLTVLSLSLSLSLAHLPLPLGVLN